MKIVKSVKLHAAQTELTGMTGPINRQLRLQLIVGDDGTVFLPLEAGMTFGFMLRNLANHMVAYPMYMAHDNTLIRNVFDETAGVLDPNTLPGTGGMLEASEKDSDYQYAAADGFMEPNDGMRQFTATEGFIDGQSGATELVIFRRTNPDVTMADMLGLTAKEQAVTGTRGESSGLVIGAGASTSDGRTLTDLTYLQDASDPIVRIKIIGRQQAAEMLSGADIEVPDVWTCGAW